MIVISGFRRETDENCTVLGYYDTSSGNFLPKFRGNLWDRPSRAKNKKKYLLSKSFVSGRNVE